MRVKLVANTYLLYFGLGDKEVLHKHGLGAFVDVEDSGEVVDGRAKGLDAVCEKHRLPLCNELVKACASNPELLLHLGKL